MRKPKALFPALLLPVILGMAAGRGPEKGLTISGGQFLLEGKPIQIISGEMHYARIPREYWRERLRFAKAMGLNTISTYTFWNLHEPQPGGFDFSGQNDVAAFVRLAKAEGMYVILRPGPYVCSEWDLGGLPAWLLADPGTVLRSTDERFMRPAERWIARLGQELAGQQFASGGPIIAVQVENEYGSFENDAEYLRRIYNALRAAGFDKSLLYTADGPAQLAAGTLPGVPAAVNLGPGGAATGLQVLAKFRPGEPLLLGEWWAGWFDHWGRPHHSTDGEKEASELDWVLRGGYSINIYMFHGGTNWGFMNGANRDAGGYWPDTSSYDYSAALDESGRPTKKYFLFREVIAKRTGRALPEVPPTTESVTLAAIRLDRVAQLFENLPAPVERELPVNMETLGQSFGYILYRTEIAGPVEGELAVRGLRDYARVYVDGRLAGTMDRRLSQDRVVITVNGHKARLDILVENSGRINFTKAMREERKGITGDATLAGRALKGWRIYCLPMTDLGALRYTKPPAAGPAFYRGTFRAEHAGDTFLDFGMWTKGNAWVNGHALGRFWKIGPQQTLYVPGAWLHQGENEIVVFDLEPQPKPEVKGLRGPLLDDLREPHPSLGKN